jgi:hypothetical protein
MTCLVIDEEYIIISKTKYKNKIQVKIYSGIYYGDYYDSMQYLFGDVGRINKPYNVKYIVKPLKIFTSTEQYIKLKEIKQILEKSERAKANMEQRSLNIILKRLVNEEFEWP